MDRLACEISCGKVLAHKILGGSFGRESFEGLILGTYFMSFFLVSRGVAEAMEKNIREFLWEGADEDHHGH